jgi:hypothetical protein
MMIKTDSFPLILLKIYALLWILAGGLGLYIGFPNLLQGKFEIPYIVLALPVGVGLFFQSRYARTQVLIVLFVTLAFDIFLFLMAVTSSKFSESAITINGILGGETKVPNPIFYPLSLSLLAGQIWFLFSKPILRLFPSEETDVALTDKPNNFHDFVSKNRINKRKSLLRTNLIVICPKCKTRVFPNIDSTCPSCQAKIPAKNNARAKPAS